jgi:hypothetical protein
MPSKNRSDSANTIGDASASALGETSRYNIAARSTLGCRALEPELFESEKR